MMNDQTTIILSNKNLWRLESEKGELERRASIEDMVTPPRRDNDSFLACLFSKSKKGKLVGSRNESP